MCILCVVQRWSRRVATMLPWLVIPLIILWALSQLLPPALRFEITSPRLACVLVLLATLFWYEILMPYLSSWRARRTARLRERRRTEALELQKLRKTATRRCRNCHMPYRDQNPGGGRFMCSYCGHISKRPALDLPDQMESPGMISDIVGKNNWLCYADGNGNWATPDSKCWNGDRICFTDRSCFGAIFFVCKLLSCFFAIVRWLCGKFFRFGYSNRDGSSDSDHIGLLGKGENGGNFHESKWEKAKRKAEEKRQARLEKEMLEEEEKKQREEVARLVEERRQLRDEILAAEMDRSKSRITDADRNARKEMEKRRRDRRKEKDKASSKSNSDGEEIEKRASRENERKRELEKKVESELRDLQKAAVGNQRFKSVNNSRYFDRMKGSFLSSSRGFTGPFFGRNNQNPSATKLAKPAPGISDHGHISGYKRDSHSAVHLTGKSFSAADKAFEKSISRLAPTDAQPKTTVIKKSWQQLFTRSSSVSPYPDAMPLNKAGQLTDQNDSSSNKGLLQSCYFTDNPGDYEKSFPFTVFSSSTNSSKPAFPLPEEPSRSVVSEDVELFEDPCYDPDPISLLGPVSESLDKFPSDLDTRFTTRQMTEKSPYLKNILTSLDASKPSPIEPPLSKSHFFDGMRLTSEQQFCSPKSDGSWNMQEQSTWQMWGSPLAQEGLGLIGRPSSWFSPLAHNSSQQHDALHSLSLRSIASPPLKSNIGNFEQNSRVYIPLGPTFSDNATWQPSSFLPPSQRDGDDHLLPVDLMVNVSQSEDTYSSPLKSTVVRSFEQLPTNSFTKDDIALWDGSLNAESSKPKRDDADSFFSRGPDASPVWFST